MIAARSSVRDLPVTRDFVGLDCQFRSSSVSIVGEHYEEATCPTPSLYGPRRNGACDCLEWGVQPIASRITLAECSVMKTNEFALDDGDSSPWFVGTDQDRVAVERVETEAPTQ